MLPFALIVVWSAAAASEAEATTITHPTVDYGNPRETNRCYSPRARRTGSEGRTLVVVRIEADGSIGDMVFSPGIEPWQEETARCVLGLAKFTPGKRGGVPVVSEAQVPIHFFLDTGPGDAPTLTTPQLVSTAAEIEDACRACYPPDSLSIAEPQYRVTFSERGKATDIALVGSSGDEALDRAGRCMIENLRFEPTKRDGVRVRSTVTMPILMRPAR